jgi:FAD/FMN-containing dehydrogenase
VIRVRLPPPPTKRRLQFQCSSNDEHLRGAQGIRVDPEARTVRAQAGVLLGELDRETQAFGLAIPSGIVTHTGLSGLTLGGGINWLHRKYGLAIDPSRFRSDP